MVRELRSRFYLGVTIACLSVVGCQLRRPNTTPTRMWIGCWTQRWS